MAFLDKLGDIARNIGDKTTDAIETTRLNSKINGERAAIAECMRQIGEYYHTRHQAGGPDDPDIAELLTAIDGHNTAISETQAEIARIKDESVKQAAQTTAPVAVHGAPAPIGVACPSCGAMNPAGTKFCAECGGKLEVPAPAPQTRDCPGCGAPVPMTSKFCGDCGHRFES